MWGSDQGGTRKGCTTATLPATWLPLNGSDGQRQPPVASQDPPGAAQASRLPGDQEPKAPFSGGDGGGKGSLTYGLFQALREATSAAQLSGSEHSPCGASCVSSNPGRRGMAHWGGVDMATLSSPWLLRVQYVFFFFLLFFCLLGWGG